MPKLKLYPHQRRMIQLLKKSRLNPGAKMIMHFPRRCGLSFAREIYLTAWKNHLRTQHLYPQQPELKTIVWFDELTEDTTKLKELSIKCQGRKSCTDL